MHKIEQENNQLWIGIVMIIVGGAFLLDNLNLIPHFVPYWIFSWKMLMVVIGGAMLMTGRRNGIIFLAIGGVFLVPDIIWWPRFDVWDLWPAIFIAVGISILLRRRNPVPRPGEAYTGDDIINEVSILGGGKRVITSKNFMGGKVTSVFGGSEIYLQNAELAEGPVVIDVFVMFGGMTLVVPPDWTVKSDVFSALGGFSDARIVFKDPEGEGNKEIIIKGFIMFGGGEIKSA